MAYCGILGVFTIAQMVGKGAVATAFVSELQAPDSCFPVRYIIPGCMAFAAVNATLYFPQPKAQAH